MSSRAGAGASATTGLTGSSAGCWCRSSRCWPWRLYRRRRVAIGGAAAASSGARHRRVRRRLRVLSRRAPARAAGLSFGRAGRKSLARWLARVESARSPAVHDGRHCPLLTLHYRIVSIPRGSARGRARGARRPAPATGPYDGGPRMAPQTPQRSGRPGEPGHPSKPATFGGPGNPGRPLRSCEGRVFWYCVGPG